MKSLEKISVTLVAISALAVVSARASSAAELEAVGQKVAASKTVEAPAVAVKLVKKAAKEDKEQVALAALTAGLRAHPASLPTLLTAVIKAAPDSTDALVTAALELVPESAATIVRVASESNPAKAEAALAAAVKRVPAMKVTMEREMAATRSRRIVASAAPAPAALTVDGPVIQTPRPPAPPPKPVTAYGGFDPGRP